MNLEEKILNQYTETSDTYGHLPYTPFEHHACCEREKWYKKLLSQKFANLNKASILEIGAGAGDNLIFFHRIGIFRENLFANELVPHRIEKLRRHFLPENLFAGNILDVKTDKKFDIVFQSTVFSSILNPLDKAAIAGRMKELTAPGGVVLWYDFTYDNPKNKEVRGVKVAEVKKLFADAKKITIKRVTLAPPISRRVGEGYGFFNALFPFLRTHIVALIEY